MPIKPAEDCGAPRKKLNLMTLGLRCSQGLLKLLCDLFYLTGVRRPCKNYLKKKNQKMVPPAKRMAANLNQFILLLFGLASLAAFTNPLATA